MSSPQQLQVAKERRAANNNYGKLLETLNQKLTKLCLEYNTDIYFIAYRNGRFQGFTSIDEAGQPWLPPSPEALVSPSPFTTYQEVTPIKGKLYPPPVVKSPTHFCRTQRGRAVTFRKATLHKHPQKIKA
jgi:hypothetical protein